MLDVCWKNLSCNDVLQGDYLKRWKSWAGAVEDSTTLHPKMLQTTSIWTNYVDSIVHLFDKACVAPLKVITIPRLELSAAVVATRLNKMIRSEIDLSIDFTMFWTDSTTVLGYVANKDKRFKTFAANRLAVIHETTAPTQWRYCQCLFERS